VNSSQTEPGQLKYSGIDGENLIRGEKKMLKLGDTASVVGIVTGHSFKRITA
jgi:hypothetical protein